jgi:preprotein translocase subunit YajC
MFSIGNTLSSLVAVLMPFILLSLFFYFFVIKPHLKLKKAKEHQQKKEIP